MKAITLARKPLIGTVAKNVLKHGCGGLNIRASRISYRSEEDMTPSVGKGSQGQKNPGCGSNLPVHKENWGEWRVERSGRFPANLILQLCEDGCPVKEIDEQSIAGGMHSAGSSRTASRSAGKTGMFPMDGDGHRFGDIGGASRFFKRVKT